MVGLGSLVFCGRHHLLLFSPYQPLMPAVLGLALGASFVAALQPGHGAAPDLDRVLYVIHLLVMAASGWLSARHGDDHAGRQPALPVLGAHRTRPPPGPAGMGDEHAFAPPRPPRIKPALSRSQPRRRSHHL